MLFRSEGGERDLLVDAEIPLRALTPLLIEELRGLRPHGEGNEEPIFTARNVEVVESPRPVPGPRTEVAFVVREEGETYRASAPAWLLEREIFLEGDRIALAYSPPEVLGRWPSIRVRDVSRDPRIAPSE